MSGFGSGHDEKLRSLLEESIKRNSEELEKLRIVVKKSGKKQGWANFIMICLTFAILALTVVMAFNISFG